MTRTEELLALAEAAPTTHVRVGVALCEGKEHAALWFDDNSDHIAKANYLNATTPETIKQLIELVRLQHEALLNEASNYEDGIVPDEMADALAAFNKLEGGE